MTTVELPDSYAPIPHQLIRTQRGDLVRLYGLLHDFGWHKLPFEVQDLATAMDTTRRTIFRYLNDLATAGWIAYDKQPGHAGLGERITLYSSPSFEPQTCDTRITGLTKPVTPGSQDAQTCDPGVTACDTRITACDPGVTGTPVLPLPDAAKNALQISGRSPEDPPTPTASAHSAVGGGGGGSVVSRNSTPQPLQPGAVYLESAGFTLPVCEEFGSYPPTVLKADVQARLDAGQTREIIVTRWRRGAIPGTFQPPNAQSARAAPDPQQLAERQRAVAEQATPEERRAILARVRAQKGETYGP